MPPAMGMGGKQTGNETGFILESLYKRLHHPSYIHPDPLEIVLQYSDPGDQEIAAFIASSLATGRVKSIIKAVKEVLEPFPFLRDDLLNMNYSDLENIFRNFTYRFYTSGSLVDFLFGIKNTLKEYGSLENCFIRGFHSFDGISKESRVHRGLVFLVKNIKRGSGNSRNILPDPEKGSSCKRLNMFLRWMVRNDDIDPGIWSAVSASELVIPLDTHIMQLSRIMGFTERKQADMKTAREITAALRVFDPDDPVRFDFSLSRLGIHPDLSYAELSSAYGNEF